MPQYRIVDLREGAQAEQIVVSRTPEMAASTALGLQVMRSGNPQRLVCKAYWQSDGFTQVVRLYERRPEPLHLDATL